ncbi:uncharacterized protein LOC118184416 [Stegodyphus dumicola]|uniref:uncharacterized protein LOC118184416 n=1 Tax=Stegodyphus dumicola TaxID=202533 RepID=UPI0015B21D40|nr:uncharacterized protein LOC118184416 [Stegodyphus dumicola]
MAVLIYKTCESKTPSYDHFIKTELDTMEDQPVDYSIKYADQDTHDICHMKSKRSLLQFRASSVTETQINKPISHDEIKVYCIEGTPLAVSSSSSLHDLREIGLSIQSTEKPACSSSLIAHLSSTKNSEDSRNNKSSESSVFIEDKCIQTKEIDVANYKEGKSIVFSNADDTSKTSSPLIFSRSSSVCSLNSFEQQSTIDDRSSVSVFSTLTSGIISPSELPDSPGETVSPSLTKTKHTEFHFPVNYTEKPSNFNFSNLKRQSNETVSQKIQNGIFDDALKVYNEEDDFCSRSSLSSLSINDSSAHISLSVFQVRSMKSNINHASSVDINCCIAAEDSSRRCTVMCQNNLENTCVISDKTDDCSYKFSLKNCSPKADKWTSEESYNDISSSVFQDEKKEYKYGEKFSSDFRLKVLNFNTEYREHEKVLGKKTFERNCSKSLRNSWECDEKGTSRFDDSKFVFTKLTEENVQNEGSRSFFEDAVKDYASEGNFSSASSLSALSFQTKNTELPETFYEKILNQNSGEIPVSTTFLKNMEPVFHLQSLKSNEDIDENILEKHCTELETPESLKNENSPIILRCAVNEYDNESKPAEKDKLSVDFSCQKDMENNCPQEESQSNILMAEEGLEDQTSFHCVNSGVEKDILIKHCTQLSLSEMTNEGNQENELVDSVHADKSQNSKHPNSPSTETIHTTAVKTKQSPEENQNVNAVTKDIVYGHESAKFHKNCDFNGDMPTNHSNELGIPNSPQIKHSNTILRQSSRDFNCESKASENQSSLPVHSFCQEQDNYFPKQEIQRGIPIPKSRKDYCPDGKSDVDLLAQCIRAKVTSLEIGNSVLHKQSNEAERILLENKRNSDKHDANNVSHEEDDCDDILAKCIMAGLPSPKIIDNIQDRFYISSKNANQKLTNQNIAALPENNNEHRKKYCGVGVLQNDSNISAKCSAEEKNGFKMSADKSFTQCVREKISDPENINNEPDDSVSSKKNFNEIIFSENKTLLHQNKQDCGPENSQISVFQTHDDEDILTKCIMAGLPGLKKKDNVQNDFYTSSKNSNKNLVNQYVTSLPQNKMEVKSMHCSSILSPANKLKAECIKTNKSSSKISEDNLFTQCIRAKMASPDNILNKQDSSLLVKKNFSILIPEENKKVLIEDSNLKVELNQVTLPQGDEEEELLTKCIIAGLPNPKQKDNDQDKLDTSWKSSNEKLASQSIEVLPENKKELQKVYCTTHVPHGKDQFRAECIDTNKNSAKISDDILLEKCIRAKMASPEIQSSEQGNFGVSSNENCNKIIHNESKKILLENRNDSKSDSSKFTLSQGGDDDEDILTKCIIAGLPNPKEKDRSQDMMNTSDNSSNTLIFQSTANLPGNKTKLKSMRSSSVMNGDDEFTAKCIKANSSNPKISDDTLLAKCIRAKLASREILNSRQDKFYIYLKKNLNKLISNESKQMLKVEDNAIISPEVVVVDDDDDLFAKCIIAGLPSPKKKDNVSEQAYISSKNSNKIFSNQSKSVLPENKKELKNNPPADMSHNNIEKAKYFKVGKSIPKISGSDILAKFLRTGISDSKIINKDQDSLCMFSKKSSQKPAIQNKTVMLENRKDCKAKYSATILSQANDDDELVAKCIRPGLPSPKNNVQSTKNSIHRLTTQNIITLPESRRDHKKRYCTTNVSNGSELVPKYLINPKIVSNVQDRQIGKKCYTANVSEHCNDIDPIIACNKTDMVNVKFVNGIHSKKNLNHRLSFQNKSMPAEIRKEYRKKNIINSLPHQINDNLLSKSTRGNILNSKFVGMEDRLCVTSKKNVVQKLHSQEKATLFENKKEYRKKYPFSSLPVTNACTPLHNPSPVSIPNSSFIDVDTLRVYEIEDTPIISRTASVNDLSLWADEKSYHEKHLNISRNSDCSSESEDIELSQYDKSSKKGAKITSV